MKMLGETPVETGLTLGTRDSQHPGGSKHLLLWSWEAGSRTVLGKGHGLRVASGISEPGYSLWLPL